MKRIAIEEDKNTVISMHDVNDNMPIFVKDGKGKLIGMVIFVFNEGWAICVGKERFATNFYNKLFDCLEVGKRTFGYQYFVED